MRPERLFVAATLLFAACSTHEHLAPLPADAAWRRAPSAPQAPDPQLDSPVVQNLDPIAAEILRAALAGQAHERRVILENIANVNTPGYKRRVVESATEFVESGSGVRYAIPVVSRPRPLFTAGALGVTERECDIAIDGDGFFSVVLPDGSTAYTRDGSFVINADGKVVTGEGHVLTPQIMLPGDLLCLSIDGEGRFSGNTAGSPDTSTLFGQIQLHRFMNPSGMRLVGRTWRPTEQSGRPLTGTPGSGALGTLLQGYVERSNVQLEQELLDLQLLERRRETLMRVLEHFGMVAM